MAVADPGCVSHILALLYQIWYVVARTAACTVSQVGDCRLLVDSPEYGLLSGAEEGSAAAPNSADDTATTICYVPSRQSLQVTSSSAAPGQPHRRVGTPLSCQMGFFVR